MKQEIQVSVRLTDGYRKRWTDACLDQLRRRQQISREIGDEGKKKREAV